jgi:glycerate 2-kinase
MSILVAPDSFKGTFTAVEVAGYTAAGVRSAGGETTELPVADGGEGTFEVLVRGLDAGLFRPRPAPTAPLRRNPA